MRGEKPEKPRVAGRTDHREYKKGKASMAKLELSLTGSFNELLSRIENGILEGSATASLEDASDFRMGGLRCSVRVFERYSMLGQNRVSLSVTLFGSDDRIQLSAIAAGGSQAMLFKVNTFGEEAFLDRLRELL